MPALFLVLGSIDYGGSSIISAHASMRSAEDEAERLMAADRCLDGYEVRAIGPGAGRGVTVAPWRGEWTEDAVPEDGPTQPGDTTPLRFVTERRWRRTL